MSTSHAPIDPSSPKPDSEATELDEPMAPPARKSPTATIWILTLVAASIAALSSWLNGEQYFEHFKPSAKASAEPYNFVALNREKAIADRKNLMIAYGFLGLSFGLCMGLAGGLARHSAIRGLIAAGVGAIVGVAACAVLSYFLMPVYRKHLDPAQENLVLPFLVHGAIWAAMGLAGGLAFGLGWGSVGRVARSLVAGLLGAIVGTLLYEIVQAEMFSHIRNDELIAPESVLRALAYFAVCLTAAAAVAIANSPREGEAAPA